MANINLTTGNDTFGDDDNSNQIFGLGGNDVIYANGGADSVNADEGNDTVYGWTGNDSLSGGQGNDQLFGDQDNDTLRGGQNEDTIYAGIGNDSINGDEGNDIIFADDGNDTIATGRGNDTVTGGAGDDMFVIERAPGTTTLINDFSFEFNKKIDLRAFDSNFANFDALRPFIVGGQNGNQIFTTINLPDGQKVVLNGVFEFDLNTFYFIGNTGIGKGNDYIITFANRDDLINADANQNNPADGGNDTVFANDGNDTINGEGGNDLLYGGNGRDLLNAGFGNDFATGDAGDDTVTGGAGTDSIYGGADNDSVDGGDDVDFVGGDAGNDTLTGGAGNDSIFGWTGDDSILGGSGNDVANGEDGNDTVTGEAGDDSLYGSDGNDKFIGGTGADYVDGGNGRDIISYATSSQAVNVDLEAASGSGGDAEGDVMIDVEDIEGSAFADTLRGNSITNTVYGLGGNDTIRTAQGVDTLVGGADNDRLEGGTEKDDYVFTFDGTNGNDTIGNDNDGRILIDNNLVAGQAQQTGTPNLFRIVSSGVTYLLAYNATAKTLTITEQGNIANESVTIDDFQSGDFDIDINPSDGIVDGTPGNDDMDENYVDPEGDKFTPGDDIGEGYDGNDTMESQDGDDTLQGGGGDDSIDAGPGDDTACGTEGNDTVIGGAGDDTLCGNVGDDSLSGEDGNDSIGGGDGNDTGLGGNGNDTIFGDAGNDSLSGGTGTDTLDGGADNDTIDAGDGNDTACGGIGNDLVIGGAGNDNLCGNLGNDTLQGNAGNDTLGGGEGNDRLDGGADADRFNFTFDGTNGNDTVTRGTTGDQLVVTNGPSVDTISGAATQTSPTTYELTVNGNTYIFTWSGVPGSSAVITEKNGNANESITIEEYFDGDYDIDTPNPDGIVDGTAGNDLMDAVYIDPQGDRFTTGNDRGIGYAGNDTMTGLAGNDTLEGREGDDSIQGNDGNDSLIGGAGNDRENGQAGNDDYRFTFDGTNGHDTVAGALGSDRLMVQKGAQIDVLQGTAVVVAPNLYELAVNGRVYQLAWNGVNGTTAVITEKNGNANESITIEQYNGGDFDIDPNTPDGIVDGTAGNDLMDAAYIDPQGDRFTTGNDRGIGYAGNDTMTGLAGNDTLEGREGNDSIQGNEGNDTIIGGIGNDRMNGQAGNDDYGFAFDGTNGHDTVAGALGSDRLIVQNGASIDVLQGQAVVVAPNLYELTVNGNVYQIAWNGVNGTTAVITEKNGNANESITIEQYNGGDFDIDPNTPDGIVDGTAGNDLMDAAYIDPQGDRFTTGNDRGIGYAGNDTMTGLAGNDTLEGREGNDVLIGGTGGDEFRFNFSGTNGNDTISGAANIGDKILVQNGAMTDLIAGQPIKIQPNVYLLTVNGNNYLFTWSGVNGTTAVITEQNGNLNESITIEQFNGGDYDIDPRDPTPQADGTVDGTAGNDLMDVNYVDPQTDRFTDSNNYGIGYAGNDTMTGLNGNDTLEGRGGNDLIYGERPVDQNDFGHDSISGGDGNDTLDGGVGDDTVFGDAGDDSIIAGRGNNNINGGDGNDTILSGKGLDMLTGGTGDDTYHVTIDDNGHDTIIDNDGDLSVFNNTSSLGGLLQGDAEFVSGTLYKITVGGLELNLNWAGQGSDLVISRTNWNNDSVTIKNYTNGTFNLNLRQGDGIVNGTTGNDLMDVNYIDPQGDRFTTGNDVGVGYEGNDTMTGLAGNDTIFGSEGRDSIIGGAGNDELSGDRGQERRGSLLINGGFEADQIAQNTYNLLNNLTGWKVTSPNGYGVELQRFTPAAAAQTGTVAAVEGAQLLELDQAAPYRNSVYQDVQTLGVADFVLQFAYAQRPGIPSDQSKIQVLWNGQVIDTISSGTTNWTNFTYHVKGAGDITRLEFRSDKTALPGAGGLIDNVTLSYDINQLGDTIDAGEGNDVVRGGMGSDLIYGSDGNDTVYGDENEDTIYGNAGSDALVGDFGNDVLSGGGGDDSLRGGEGNDQLYGDQENDYILGSAGNDTLIGGSGNDTIGGEAGNDLLGGQDGIDTYGFMLTSSEGQDTIHDDDGNGNIFENTMLLSGTATATGTPGFYSLTANGAAYTLKWTGGDLVITKNGVANDSITVKNYVNGTFNLNLGAAAQVVDPDNQQGATINGTEDDDWLTGTGGRDYIWGNDDEDTIYGGSGHDTVLGGDDEDIIYGGNGNDILHGDNGEDYLYGENGNDTLYGDRDDDTVEGGAGNDQLWGFSGEDLFILQAGSYDVIKDWSGNDDEIRVVGASSMNQIQLVDTANGIEVRFNGGAVGLVEGIHGGIGSQHFDF